MASCRVYLFTYKRNNLLPRAITGLLNQTFTDWVCEVHNDCPGDEFPSKYIASLNDKRFAIHDHGINIGAVAAFNLAFAGCKEAYASILEDDNWWEPAFLTEMIAVLNAKPSTNVVWSNMYLWQEKVNREWENTGQTIWPLNSNGTIFNWPDSKQAMSALHSNGAMLYRGSCAPNYLIPENTLFNAIELIRERSFEHPVYLNNKPLANFAITLSTNRTNDPYTWIATQVMLLASFIEAADDKEISFKKSLLYYRAQKPSPVANFFIANLFILKDRTLYRLFNLADWLIIGKWLIRNGVKLNYLKAYLKANMNIYQYLVEKTQTRYKESITKTGK